MGRKADPARRAEILAALAAHLVRHGLTDLTVRSAAAALGTSPQLLLYHFHSKERMLSEAIAAMRDRHRTDLAKLLPLFAQDASPEQTPGLQLTWRWWTHPTMAPYLRLFWEVYALAIRDPRRYRRYLDLIDADHRQMLEVGLVAMGIPAGDRARALGTLYYGAFRGLILDLLTTGERERVDAGVVELDRALHDQLRTERTMADAMAGSAQPAPTSAPRRALRATRRG